MINGPFYIAKYISPAKTHNFFNIFLFCENRFSRVAQKRASLFHSYSASGVA